MVRKLLGIAPAACLLAVLGCGGSENNVAPVSGRVTLDGQPLAGAQVLFTPTEPKGGSAYAGTQSAAITDADGKYTLLGFETGTGAIVGKHRVEINKTEEGGATGKGATLDAAMQSAAADLTAETLGQLNKNVLPPKYNSQSVLTFEVTPEGTDAADFNLTTKE